MAGQHLPPCVWGGLKLTEKPAVGEDESKRNLPRQGRTLHNTEIRSGVQNISRAQLFNISVL